MIGEVINREKELEKSLDVLRDKGFDVSEDSNITRLLTAISETTASNKEEINSIIEKLTFDGRSGELLDELYGFFGIPRIIKDVTGSSVTFLNNGSNTISIDSNTIFEYQGKSYRTVTQQFINRKESKEIYAYPTGIKIFDDNYVSLGEFKVALKNITVENIPESNKESYLLLNTLMSDFKLTLDKENDLEYQSRAKGLIQHFGDSNISKIKSYIMGIERVSDVKVEREFERIKIIIIPEELRYLNRILEQAKESVDYFSSSPIVFDNPTITQLTISGITEQLIKWFDKGNTNIGEYILGVKQYLDEYVKDVYLSGEKTISRDSIEFTINKYFVDNDIAFSLNEKQLKINYAIYSDEDYVEPLIINELDSRQVKEIKTDILIVGDVS